MKTIAIFSLIVLSGLFLIKGSNPFSVPGEGLTLVETEPETVSAPVAEEETPALEIDQEQAERLVDEALFRFQEELNAAQRAFEKRVNSAFEQARSDLLSQLQMLVDDKITRRSLVEQTGRMAVDLITSGSSRADEWATRTFEEPLRPILEELSNRISMARHQWEQDRDRALSALETRLITQIPAELEQTAQASHIIGGSVLSGPAREGKIAAASLGLTGVATGVFLKLDVADLKKAPATLKVGTARALEKFAQFVDSERIQKILGKRLAPVAKRFAQKIAGSGVLAVADGPLPIGDVIAVAVTGISTVWTVYEVWSLGSGARANIMEDAEENFEKLGKQFRAEIIEPVRRDHQNLISATTALRGALLAEFSKY